MPIPEKIVIPASKDPGLKHFYISLVKSAVRIGAGVAQYLVVSYGQVSCL